MNVASGKSSDVDHAKLKGLSGPLKQSKDGRRETIHSSPPHNVPTLVSVLSPAWGPKLLSLESTPPRARRSHTVAFQKDRRNFSLGFTVRHLQLFDVRHSGDAARPRLIARKYFDIFSLICSDYFWKVN